MWQRIKRRIFAGLLAMLPLVATYWVVSILFNFLGEMASPILEKLGIKIPGLGIILTLIFIFLLGLFITNVLGRTLLSWGEKILSRLPIINTIYNTVKQITNAFSMPHVKSFQKVILIEYPRKELWTMCFVTNESKNDKGEEFYHVFVPTTPNPTSGYFIIIPKKDSIDSNISVEDGFKTIISGGILDSGSSLSSKIKLKK